MNLSSDDISFVETSHFFFLGDEKKCSHLSYIFSRCVFAQFFSSDCSSYKLHSDWDDFLEHLFFSLPYYDLHNYKNTIMSNLNKFEGHDLLVFKEE